MLRPRASPSASSAVKMLPQMTGIDRLMRSKGSSKKLEWSVTPAPRPGSISWRMPAAEPGSRLRGSPAVAHSREPGPIGAPTALSAYRRPVTPRSSGSVAWGPA